MINGEVDLFAYRVWMIEISQMWVLEKSKSVKESNPLHLALC